jgi:hypothetical protein
MVEEGDGMNDACDDDSFELIAKAKGELMERTNIEMRPDEMAVIDNILFRCWQMGWLDQLRDSGTHYSELFGTPERAARTLAGIECGDGGCESCPLYGAHCTYDGTAQLEWLRGDAE